MRLRRVCLLLAIASCSKSGGSDPTPPAREGEPADALWDRALDKTAVGFVVTPHGVAVAEHGIVAARALLASPDFTALVPKNDELFALLLGPHAQSFSDLGLTADKGLAMFVDYAGGAVMILPVVDRAKLVAARKGTTSGDVDEIDGYTCKMLDGEYTCANHAALFDRVGKGKMRGLAQAAGARGDLEVGFDASFITGKPNRPLNEHPWSWITASMDDGIVDIRGDLPAVPAQLALFAGARGPKPDTSGVAGFMTLDVAPLLANVPDGRLLPGVSMRDLARAVKGTAVATASAGGQEAKIEIALVDPAPIDKLLEKCADLDHLVPTLTAKAVDHGCELAVEAPIAGTATITRDGQMLTLTAKSGGEPTHADVLDSVARDLASGDWTFAMWGRGSMLAPALFPMSAYAASMPDGPEVRAMLRSIAILSEVGVGLRFDTDHIQFRVVGRTVWANPKEVVDNLLAISGDDILHDRGGEAAKAIVAAAPGSPFATDFAAGQSGLMFPTSGVGMLAAVAIPAFLDYTKKSKRTEADLQLTKLMKNARTYYIENNQFPAGDVPLTPAATCCAGPNARCPVDIQAWQAKAWQELDFQIDEAHRYQYGYHSDGKTAEIFAVGDLDCDGEMATYTMHMDGEGGNPHGKLIPPPRGVQ